MMKILANDGIDAAGKALLEKAGFTVETQKISQQDLASGINAYDILIVRSATKVTAEIMDAGNLKLIARAGVGLDNIDIKHAGIKHIPVVNTPNASSRSVAELVFAHIFSCYRYLYHTNREMPSNGKKDFNELKKLAGKGFEVQDKKIGIIGFGRIGQEVARMAVGLGMDLTMSFHRRYAFNNFKIVIPGMSMEDVIKNSDIITLHTPGSAEVIGEKELAMMKDGSMLINCARGGVVNEKALKNALETGKLAFAGVDVFEQEPPVNDDILQLANTSLSPHIGASTAEAQERVGVELAERIIQFFNTKR
jgi:D-3-phosphoglycerate dehydrogenase